MLVQKCGKISPMMPSQIYGLSVASSTKCAHFTLLLRVKTLKFYTKRSRKVNTKKYLTTTLLSWLSSSAFACTKTPGNDQLPGNSFAQRTVSLIRNAKSTASHSQKTAPSICLKPFTTKVQKISNSIYLTLDTSEPSRMPLKILLRRVDLIISAQQEKCKLPRRALGLWRKKARLGGWRSARKE